MSDPTTPAAVGAPDDPDLGRQRSDARAAHVEAFGSGDAWAAYAPGRVNLIGDHTDYTGGLVLPMTIHRGTHAVARARGDGAVRVVADGYGTAQPYRVGEEVAASRDLWERYVLGVAREVAGRAATASRQGGADVYVTGDMPIGAGLSSSASLTVAVALALAAVWDVEVGETEMALLAQRVEHVDAGVNCGIMDQVAVRSGRAGHAVLLDCRSLEHRAIAVPADRLAVVIVDSGAERSLADSAYNARRAAVEGAADALREAGVLAPDGAPVASLRDVTPDALAAHAGALDPTALRRARHVVTENGRVLDAAAALEAGDFGRVGALMSESHASLRDDYDVSGPELDVLVQEAMAAGAVGARLTGAGFGGCTVNLVRQSEVEAFAERVAARYADRAGRDGRVFVVRDNREAHVVGPDA